MLDNEKTEVVDENEVVNSPNVGEELVFHYDNHVSCSTGNLTARDGMETFFSKKIVRTIIPLILSALLLWFSFMPFLTIQGLTVGTKTYSVSFSCVDCINLSVQSCYSLNDEELLETEMAKELLSEQDLESILKKQVYLTVLSEEMPITPSVIMLGFVSLVYMVICAVIFMISLVKLILLFLFKFQKEPSGHCSESLFCFLLCMVPLWLYCALQTVKAIRLAVFSFADGNVSEELAMGSIASMILLGIATAMIFLGRLLQMTRFSEWKFKRCFNKHSLSIVLVLLIFILVFAPCLHLSGSNRIGVGFGDFIEISDSTLNYYADISQADSYEMLTEYVEASNDTAGHVDQVMELLTIGYCRMHINPLYMVFNILSIVILVFAGLLLWHILQNAFWKKNNGGKLNRVRGMLLIGVLTYFLMLVVWTLLININLINQSPIVFRLVVGTAPVVMLIATLGTLFCPLDEGTAKVRKAKKKKRIK